MIRKLNLGCGEDKKEGYVNVDHQASVSPDVRHDLNAFPYPFPDDFFHLIEASHVLEHLESPFSVMRELERILAPGGKLIIKVPHFSRGFTHAEHAHGFDITFPLYFDERFTRSGYYGVSLTIEKMRMNWLAFFHLYKYMHYGRCTIWILRIFHFLISFFANLNQPFCSRIWCFWVGGFDEIVFEFVKERPPCADSKSASDQTRRQHEDGI